MSFCQRYTKDELYQIRNITYTSKAEAIVATASALFID